MDASPFRHLPDELIDAIVFHLPADATLAFGTTCKRSNRFAFEHLVWRRHCVVGWRYWEPKHELQEKLRQPPAQVKWRQLYQTRKATDANALALFDLMLTTQQHRVQRIEDLGKMGYDIKDCLLKMRNCTPPEAEDALARTYYATAVLARLHRATALEKWMRLQKHQMVRLEEVLGAYDLFIVADRKGDLTDIEHELDLRAAAIRAADPAFDDANVRTKALRIVRWLRDRSMVGCPDPNNYSALRNNFLSMALFDSEVQTSLPLQSVAIFCAIARRLGVDAKPSNYPYHVHAVIEAPADRTLDGVPRQPSPNADPDLMFVDPWRSADEVDRQSLALRLSQMGAPTAQHAFHLGPTSTLEIALRTGRNIMNSVNDARRHYDGSRRNLSHPDVDAAWYSVLWSMMVLGDSNAAAAMHRRRQCLEVLADHFCAHFPEDLGLVESVVAPMFEGEREHDPLMHLVTTQRIADRNAKPICPRLKSGHGVKPVLYKVGQHFKHRRYGYEAVIIGWNYTCTAEDRWIAQMRVDDLPGGRTQPFYHVLGEDHGVRYVAEENIGLLHEMPCDSLMQLAGRHFKRWDDVEKAFVSNIRDEYPDD